MMQAIARARNFRPSQPCNSAAHGSAIKACREELPSHVIASFRRTPPLSSHTTHGGRHKTGEKFAFCFVRRSGSLGCVHLDRRETASVEETIHQEMSCGFCGFGEPCPIDDQPVVQRDAKGQIGTAV